MHAHARACMYHVYPCRGPPPHKDGRGRGRGRGSSARTAGESFVSHEEGLVQQTQRAEGAVETASVVLQPPHRHHTPFRDGLGTDSTAVGGMGGVIVHRAEELLRVDENLLVLGEGH
jgi:hypothetical protein